MRGMHDPIPLHPTSAPRTDAASVIARQREYFRSGQTRPLSFRRKQLRAFRDAIKRYEDQLLEALRQDLGRCVYEGYYAETMFVDEELIVCERSLEAWAEDRFVASPLLVQPSQSYVRPEPKGVVLVIAPWNYPIQLALAPIGAAIAAGNCSVLKPSELSPNTSRVMTQMIRDSFDPGFITSVEGDAKASEALLNEPWDHIFFTGSTGVGKIVMTAAAKHLVPVTLELGGKSPAFVSAKGNVMHAAKRIAWSKTLNAGQTCVATDYALVEKSVLGKFIEAYKKVITDRYGADPKQSADYARIVNARHFERIRGYLSQGSVAFGGTVDETTRYIAPTLMTDVPPDSPLMTEEIFGPILPVVAVDSMEQALSITNAKPHPLAMYVFSDNHAERERLSSAQTSGGLCFNDAIFHLANPNLPFGGVGASGMGAYHGRTGFDAFSHLRAVFERRFHFENPLVVPPYKMAVSRMRRLMQIMHLID